MNIRFLATLLGAVVVTALFMLWATAQLEAPSTAANTGFAQARCIPRAAEQVKRFFVRTEFFQRHEHGRGLAAVAGDNCGFAVFAHLIEVRGEVFAEFAIRGGAHFSVVRVCVRECKWTFKPTSLSKSHSSCRRRGC